MKLDNGKASNSEITNTALEDKTKSNSTFDVNFNNNKNESVNGEEKNGLCEKSEEEQQDQEFIFIHDTCFNVKIDAPGVEPFYIQVSSMELAQEIHHLLMDRADTCHRTCFSLQLNGNTLDNFVELKNIEGLQEGSVIKVVEEPYTVRETRIHVRHIRDLLKSLDSTDAYNGLEGNSLSFVNVIAQGDIFDKKKKLRPDSVDCTPPDYILPNNKERPLTALQPQIKEQKPPTALKVLTTSGWNPPPGSRKLHCDILYLYVITLEDKRYHITASTRGFYVNLSTEEQFNPKPANPKFVYHSLIDLLNSISPLFKKNFSYIQKKKHQKHPLERVATPYQNYSWTAPLLDHTIDSIRAEDAFSSKLGYEEHIPGQIRDWNDELQTTRELSRKTLPDRLLRERAIFKVYSDFVAAATRGAIAVIDGNVMAINPGDETKMQMFIWNNIFFSLGFDVRDHYKELGGDAAAYVAPNNDLQGVKAYSNVDIEGLHTLGTVVIDYRSYRVTAQSIIPGILDREHEQSVVYGSVDFGKTVVTEKKYLELLGKAGQMLKILPHKVLNENGEEVEICSSVECKGIIGNDGRHYILDLLRTFPPDVNFFPINREEYSDEVKEMGFPRVHRHKLCCLRQELIDSFFESRYMMFIKLAAYHLQHRQSIKEDDTVSDSKTDKLKLIELSEKLNYPKQELDKQQNIDCVCINPSKTNETKVNLNSSEDYKNILKSFTKQEAFEMDSTKDLIKKAAQAVKSLDDTEFDIRFNPDVFSPTVRHANENGEEIKKQRKLVIDAAEFLLTIQIPNFIRSCLENTIAPLDGITLSELLHIRGINIRYLGRIANLLKNIPQLDYLQGIVITELICRSAKHVYNSYIQKVETMNLALAISHFLNCFISSRQSTNNIALNEEVSSKPSKRKAKRRNRQNPLMTQYSNEWAMLTSKSLWNNLKNECDSYYGWKLNSESINHLVEMYRLQKISILRSFCIKTGIQILLRDYKFDSKTKPAFSDEDILNVFPIVKHINPRATDAYNFYTTGQAKIQQGYLREGYELISEAFNLLNNVYGAMHPEIAQCLRLLARLNYIMGDHSEAMACQQKAVLMSEKVNGIDHPYTITEYSHLALYCFANSQVSTALKLFYRARYLLLLICGENHPEMALLDSNIGLILHTLGEYELSLRFLENALNLNIHYFGPKCLKAAVSYHLVARTQSCIGDFRAALQNEKETYSIYKLQLGEEHEKTKESSECLRHLTQQAVVLQKKMNEIYKGNSVGMIPPIQIQPPFLSSVLEMLNIINGILFVQISPQEIESLKKDMKEDGLDKMLVSKQLNDKTLEKVDTLQNGDATETLKSANGISEYTDDKDTLD